MIKFKDEKWTDSNAILLYPKTLLNDLITAATAVIKVLV